MSSLVLHIIMSMLQMSPVFTLAAFGQLLTQKSGVHNLGIEGIMASGAVFAVYAYAAGLGNWMGLFTGFVIGLVYGVLLGVLCVKLKLDQIVVGFGVWFLGLGVAGAMYGILLAPKHIVVPKIPDIVFGLDPIFFLSIALLAFFMFFFSKMKWGLAVKAVGENPMVADSAGVDVEKVRLICAILASGLMGLSGAYLAVDVLQGFNYKMIAGYGWMAFALVIFGRWNTLYVFLGSLLFTGITAVSTGLTVMGIIFMPLSFVSVLPHIGVLVALTVSSIRAKETGMPAALGQPYKK